LEDVVVAMLDVVVAVDEDVVDDDVEAVDVVVDVALDAVDIANPQPCDGSFSASGSETGVCDGNVLNDGAVVVVEAVEPVVVPVASTVVVVLDDVVLEEAGVFFEISRPAPVSTSARSATERVTRSGQRRCGRAFGELRISLSR
jgi:hypothetical protein